MCAVHDRGAFYTSRVAEVGSWTMELWFGFLSRKGRYETLGLRAIRFAAILTMKIRTSLRRSA